MTHPPFRRAVAFAPLLLLAGCAGMSSGYPSLLPRPVEQGGATPAPNPPAPAPAPDPALDASIARMSGERTALEQRFDAALASAERAIAAAEGSAAGSDRWLTAQLALGQLDLHRDALSGLVGDLERLATDRGIEGLDPYPALTAALDAARGSLAERRARIAALEARLAPAV